MDHLLQTVAAIATPAGAGGIGIVKISGPEAFAAAQRAVKLRSGEALSALGREMSLDVRIQREEIFNAMHKI